MPVARAADGCRLHYDIVGTGPEHVVLIPGLGGDGRFWDGVAAFLADRVRVVTVDHRGGGRSDRPDGPYSIGGIARDVLCVMDGIGLERAHLAGHSTGGTVVQTLALDAAGRLGRIVVSGSWERADARFRSLFGVRLALLRHGLLREYQELTHVIGFPAAYLDEHAQELEAAVAEAPRRLEPVAVTAARIRMLLDFDRSAELGAITAPTLVLSAPDDEMIPIHHGFALASAIPGARFETLPGGHFFPRVAPEAYAALLLDHCLAR